MHGDLHFFLLVHMYITSFSDSFHYNRSQKNLYVGSFHYFAFIIHMGSNCYMNTGVRDLLRSSLI